MPIVTATIRKPKPAAFKSLILDSVHAALVEAGVHPDDRFQRVIELAADDFRYHPTFPDLRSPRADDFVLVEILLGIGRSAKVKRRIVAGVIERLAAGGVEPEHVMIVFQDVAWENWSPGGGRIPHG